MKRKIQTPMDTMPTEIEQFGRMWTAENLEEYTLSVCLHNKQALAHAMSTLVGVRDFKPGANQDAFAVIEMRYEKGKSLDPVVIMDTWIDLGIYNNQTAKSIAGKFDGDVEYEEKIDELAEIGGSRKAKKDIEELWDMSKRNVGIETLTEAAYEKAQAWSTGNVKKYKTGAEVEEEVRNETVGEKLNLGIPLFDDQLYKNAGLHKGTMKGKVFRSKHGKTRQECWEVAQHLRQGRTVLYFTLEGQARDIMFNVMEILQDEWDRFKYNLLLRDSVVDLSGVRSAIIEAVFADQVDVVVIDYIQEMRLNVNHFVDENVRYNDIIRDLVQLCVKYDFLLDLLSQAVTEDKNKSGWGNVPAPHDAYGSKQIIKAASLLLVGFRPNLYPELVSRSPLDGSMSAKDMEHNTIPYSSVFMKPVRSRKEIDCLHRYVHLVDTKEGMKIHRYELI